MQCRLHELRHKRRISVAAASKDPRKPRLLLQRYGSLHGHHVRRRDPLEGPALYYIDSDGTRLAGNLFCVGSGQTFAYGVLDAEYRYDLNGRRGAGAGKEKYLGRDA